MLATKTVKPDATISEPTVGLPDLSTSEVSTGLVFGRYPVCNATGPNYTQPAASPGAAGNVTRVMRPRKACPTHRVEGEEFDIEREFGMIYLVHPKWSLVGMGRNIPHATADLREQARLVKLIYVDVPFTSFTAEAVNLRNFILDILS